MKAKQCSIGVVEDVWRRRANGRRSDIYETRFDAGIRKTKASPLLGLRANQISIFKMGTFFPALLLLVVAAVMFTALMMQ